MSSVERCGPVIAAYSRTRSAQRPVRTLDAADFQIIADLLDVHSP
jgi:hypothetical protein